MTTPAAATLYEAQHVYMYEGRPTAVYNPNALPVSELPVIYGFNNGGEPGWMSAVAIAQDGTVLGGHCCSSEGYMPADLGVIEGSRPDRHEKNYRPHYPNGYRMEFVGSKEVKAHAGLISAFALHNAKEPQL
jgi:hypothetical protein